MVCIFRFRCCKVTQAIVSAGNNPTNCLLSIRFLLTTATRLSLFCGQVYIILFVCLHLAGLYVIRTAGAITLSDLRPPPSALLPRLNT